MDWGFVKYYGKITEFPKLSLLQNAPRSSHQCRVPFLRGPEHERYHSVLETRRFSACRLCMAVVDRSRWVMTQGQSFIIKLQESWSPLSAPADLRLWDTIDAAWIPPSLPVHGQNTEARQFLNLNVIITWKLLTCRAWKEPWSATKSMTPLKLKYDTTPAHAYGNYAN